MCRLEVFWLTVFSLLYLHPQVSAAGEYSRQVNYQNEIVVRCPDKNKATVKILQAHADVWHLGKESVDIRVNRQAFAKVQNYFRECSVIIENLEVHVQAAEAKMFPKKKAEQEAWMQDVIRQMFPDSDVKECEARIQEMEEDHMRSEDWFREYHDYEAIKRFYQLLRDDYSNVVTYKPSIGKTGEGRDMPCIHITGSRESDNKKRFYIQCQIHAREWISGATCMYIAKYLAGAYGINETISGLLDKLEFVLVPFVNPDGYVYTWTTDRMWRKNRKRVLEDTSDNCVGVDINRNFPTGFRLSENYCGEDYGGPRPISELETKHIIANFRNNAPIVGSLDVHSYGQLILRPWGKNSSIPPDEAFHARVSNTMKDLIREVHGSEYTAEHSFDLYYCYGIVADWLYSDDAASTNGGYRSASLCIELRDTENGYGFLLPANQIIPTAEEVVPAVIFYAREALEKPIEYTPITKSMSHIAYEERVVPLRHH